ncbi:MAG: type II toxin-antitoxin system VapC family toxin [Leptolyngbyaceae cyanobacterium]
MKLLLDTHAFIWWDGQSEQISAAVLSLLKQPQTEIFVSIASLWEIQIKSQLGKLELRESLSVIVQQQERINHIVLLPIALAHILELDRLPQHHKAPFDRLLIAQSRIESATLVTRDSAFNQYDCQILW